MNAFTRNYCEREILLITKEISLKLNIELELEAEALQEGGLKEIWKAVGKNSVQISLVIAVLTIIISRIPVESKLKKENLRLDNELKRLEIQEIKNRLKSNDEIRDEIVEEVYEMISRDYKILWHRSNFYKKVSHQLKITKVSTRILDNNNRPLNDEKSIERKDFYKAILTTDTLPSLDDDEAIIDIIAPVITKGKYTWKGYYQGEPISFEMGDSQFKNSINNKEIEFKNGTAIKCVLRQNRKIDENGMIKVTKSRVLVVLEVIDDYKSIETNQGKQLKRIKKLNNNQLDLFKS